MELVLLAILFGLLFILNAAYLVTCFMETGSDRIRLVTYKGSPLRIQKPGWGFVWTPFQTFFDYTKKFITFDLTEEMVITKSGEVEGYGHLDENSLFIDSELYFYIVPRDDDDHDQLYRMKQMWEHGLKPSPKDMISSGDDLKPLLQNFVQATQREVAASMHWWDVLFGDNFIKTMTQRINSSRSIASEEKNPFDELGLKHIRYVVRKIKFTDPKMNNALHGLAIAKQEGQAVVKRSEDEAIALRNVYGAIEQHPQAAALRALENTGNHWVLTFNPNLLPEVLGGKR